MFTSWSWFWGAAGAAIFVTDEERETEDSVSGGVDGPGRTTVGTSRGLKCVSGRSNSVGVWLGVI